MTATTFDRECTLWSLADARMAAYPDDAAARARIERAIDLVPTVERTRTRDLWLVPSATDDGVAYHVYRGACHCPDAQQRDPRGCKHAHAVALFQLWERAEVDARLGLPAIAVAAEDSILDLWPTDGEPCDLAPQCSRCQAEPRTTRHPDGLGAACIHAELYGEAR